MRAILQPGLVALGITLVLTPVMRWLGHRIGAVDRPASDGLTIHRAAIPCLGGAAILPALLAGLVIAPRFLSGTGSLPAIAIGAIVVFALGAWDDRYGLAPRFRLLIHFAVGLVLAAGGLQVRIVPELWIAVPVTALIVATAINAVNMTDGMDGLATGISAITAMGAVGLGLIEDDPFLVVTGALLLGSLVGFLPFNFHRASIFLGDGGSGLLGFWIAMLLSRVMGTPFTLPRLAAPALLFALPLTDMMMAIGRRLGQGASVSIGDRRHLYDRLMQQGFSQPRTWCIVCSTHALLVVLGLSAAFITRRTEQLAIDRAAGNLIVNASFEADDNGDGLPDGWNWRITSAMSRGPCLGRWEEASHHGRRSVSISEGRWESSSRWTGRCRDITPDTWYALSLSARRDRDTGWTPSVRLFGESRTINLRRPGKWQHFEWLIHSGPTRGESPLELVCYKKPYKVWFDNLRLVECRTPLLRPRDRHRVVMRPVRFTWQAPGVDALFEHVLDVSRDRSFLDPEYSVLTGPDTAWALSQPLARGQWFWRVRTLHNGRAVCHSEPRRLFSGPPPLMGTKRNEVWVGEDLFLRVDGQPFFPLGLCGSRDIPLARQDAAFNTLMGEATTDAPRKSGYLCVPLVPKRGKVSVDRSRTNLLAWWLYDEPGQHNLPPREVRRLNDAVKAVGNHPTTVVIYHPENFARYADSADILTVDPYPIPHRPITLVSDTVDRAVATVGARRPVWAIIQAFDWSGVSDEARRSGEARLPTEDEERCMAYLAVIHGARGLFFYVSGRGHSFESPHWPALDRVIRRLRTELPAFLATPVESDIRLVSPRGDAPPVHYSVRTSDHSTYLLAANVLGSPVDAQVEGLPEGVNLRELSGRPLAGSTIHFSPLQAMTLVVETRDG